MNGDPVRWARAFAVAGLDDPVLQTAIGRDYTLFMCILREECLAFFQVLQFVFDVALALVRDHLALQFDQGRKNLGLRHLRFSISTPWRLKSPPIW